MDRGHDSLTIGRCDGYRSSLDELTQNRLVTEHDADLTLGGLSTHQGRIALPQLLLDRDE